MQGEQRFEWERILSRNEWEQLIRALPVTSPLFAHDRCKSYLCRRPNGWHLRPSTVKHVGLVLATFARPDGTRAFPGLDRMKTGTAFSRPTVIAGLRHLETVGLVLVQIRAGTLGVARDHASVYCLSSPPLDSLVAQTKEQADAYSWFSRDPDPKEEKTL